jgi:hypothetical protein
MLFSIFIVTSRGDHIESKRMSHDKARRAYDSLDPADSSFYRIEFRQRGKAIFAKGGRA